MLRDLHLQHLFSQESGVIATGVLPRENISGELLSQWLPYAGLAVARHQIPFPSDALLTSTGRHIVSLAPNGRFLVYVANNQLYVRNARIKAHCDRESHS
jgi:hypothetical protein